MLPGLDLRFYERGKPIQYQPEVGILESSEKVTIFGYDVFSHQNYEIFLECEKGTNSPLVKTNVPVQ
jgi:hypothetical protein